MTGIKIIILKALIISLYSFYVHKEQEIAISTFLKRRRLFTLYPCASSNDSSQYIFEIDIKLLSLPALPKVSMLSNQMHITSSHLRKYLSSLKSSFTIKTTIRGKGCPEEV